MRQTALQAFSAGYSPCSEPCLSSCLTMNAEKTRLLHSRYNPQGEAERFVNSLSLNERIRFFILIEPGLGYMIAPLKKKFPGAKIIALYAGNHPMKSENPPNLAAPDSEWSADRGISVQDFLESEIPDTEAAELRMLEWRPALSVYGSAYLALVEETVEFIKRSDASARTLKSFGRRWFRNFLRNTGLLQNVLSPLPLSLPLLVTGAGPGLEGTIPLIKEDARQSKLFVLASSSSVAALHARNVIPNMVISTDGGGWAAFHLHECFRNTGCPIAISMTAVLPSQSETRTILPISDGSLWQILILNELQIPFITLPQRGTVAASALDLAFTLTSNEIYIAGIDLANSDIRSHARPYSLDFLQEENAARLNPVYSQTYKRSSVLKTGGSYSIYASWFEKQIEMYPKRLHSLGKNNPLFKNFDYSGFNSVSTDRTSEAEFSRESSEASFTFKTVTLHNKNNAPLKALTVLENALNNPHYSQKLQEELGILLFPGRETPSLEELANALRRQGKENR